MLQRYLSHVLLKEIKTVSDAPEILIANLDDMQISNLITTPNFFRGKGGESSQTNFYLGPLNQFFNSFTIEPPTLMPPGKCS